MHDFADILKQRKLRKRLKEVRCRMKQCCTLFLCKIYSNTLYMFAITVHDGNMTV